MIRFLCFFCLSYLAPATLQADLRFVDARNALPIEHIYTGGWEHFVGGGVAVFDCNADHKPDIFAAGGNSEARLFVSRSASVLSFSLGENIPNLIGVTGAYPIDINNDIIIDLIVLRVGPNILLKGEGDCRFTDVGEQWEFRAGDHWTTAFSATWERDNDWPTLAFGNYVDRNDKTGPFESCDVNLLYRPFQFGYTAPTPLTPGFCALSMLFSDWNRRGKAELRISNDRHYYVRDGYEQMWQINPLRERDQHDGWRRISIWGMGIASADLQHDGFPDVMLTSMGDQVLLFNNDGQYLPADYSKGTTAHRPHIGDDGRPSTGWHAEFGDINNDGLNDLFIAKGNVDHMPSNAINDPNNLLIQSESAQFTERAVEAGIATTSRSRGAALADLNQDGLLDIIVINRRAPMEIWLNDTNSSGNWVTVDLRMTHKNRYAIGAWLEIRRETTTEWHERTIGGGHASGSLLPIHIGLGNSESVPLRVWWPDGSVSEWMTVLAGEQIILKR